MNPAGNRSHNHINNFGPIVKTGPISVRVIGVLIIIVSRSPLGAGAVFTGQTVQGIVVVIHGSGHIGGAVRVPLSCDDFNDLAAWWHEFNITNFYLSSPQSWIINNNTTKINHPNSMNFTRKPLLSYFNLSSGFSLSRAYFMKSV